MVPGLTGPIVVCEQGRQDGTPNGNPNPITVCRKGDGCVQRPRLELHGRYPAPARHGYPPRPSKHISAAPIVVQHPPPARSPPPDSTPHFPTYPPTSPPLLSLPRGFRTTRTTFIPHSLSTPRQTVATRICDALPSHGLNHEVSSSTTPAPGGVKDHLEEKGPIWASRRYLSPDALGSR